MLYREPKLLKDAFDGDIERVAAVSVLYREPKLLKGRAALTNHPCARVVSVLYREPKLLKAGRSRSRRSHWSGVSVLYREPKLLKGEPLFFVPLAVLTLVPLP